MTFPKVMKTRQQRMPRNGTEYRMLNNSSTYKSRQTKDEWLNEKCTKIEKSWNSKYA